MVEEVTSVLTGEVASDSRERAEHSETQKRKREALPWGMASNLSY